MKSQHGMIQVTKGLKRPQQTSNPGDLVVIDDEGGESSQKPIAKREKLHQQGTLDAFVRKEKDTIQTIVAELVSKDGLSFRQVAGSRNIQKMLKQCGYEPPKSHTTVQQHTASVAAQIRHRIGERLKELKMKGKKFTTSIDEQTTNISQSISSAEEGSNRPQSTPIVELRHHTDHHTDEATSVLNPILKQMLDGLLIIKPTSIKNEQNFSLSSNFLSDKRKQMICGTLDDLCLLKSYFCGLKND